MVTSAEQPRLRADCPVLQRLGRSGRPVVYLDSAATAQKPQVVIDAEVDFYEKRNAAVHRGAHQLAEEATDAFEAARSGIAQFVRSEEHTSELQSRAHLVCRPLLATK